MNQEIEKSEEQQWRLEFQTSPKLQAEFSSVDAFLALKQAEARGVGPHHTKSSFETCNKGEHS